MRGVARGRAGNVGPPRLKEMRAKMRKAYKASGAKTMEEFVKKMKAAKGGDLYDLHQWYKRNPLNGGWGSGTKKRSSSEKQWSATQLAKRNKVKK